MATAPTYDINDVVYLKSSAEIGFIEAVRVSNIAYDPLTKLPVYLISRQTKPPQESTVGDQVDLKSDFNYWLTEDELLTYCDALDMAILSQEAQLVKLRARRDAQCDGT